MLDFTVWGFISEGEKYFNFNQNILAESPVDAREKAIGQYLNLVVSSVHRASGGRLTQY